MQVTVLEGFGWLLPRQLAEPAGRMLLEDLRSERQKAEGDAFERDVPKLRVGQFADGEAELVDEAQLQDKSHRYYVGQALRLDHGQRIRPP